MIEPTMNQALIEAVKAGVNVRLILNERRSSGDRVNDETRRMLEEGGVTVNWGADRFAVTHEKSIVVDSKWAMIATFNICPTCLSKTRDYGILTEDANEVADIVSCFEADWNNRPFVPNPRTKLIWSPHNTRRRMAEFIDSSRQTLDIQHPKLSDTTILERIMAAKARGVKVRLLCGGKQGISEWDILDSFSSWRMMQRAGIRIRRQKHLKLHSKLMVADGVKVLVSSFNMDRSAFDLRRELGIVVDEPGVVTRLRNVFQQDWELSKPYKVSDPLKTISLDASEATDDLNFAHE
jgi:phosphatidylserine/phosphatidylglycerophosphate/cardiolipin synthase-like enzyme